VPLNCKAVGYFLEKKHAVSLGCGVTCFPEKNWPSQNPDRWVRSTKATTRAPAKSVQGCITLSATLVLYKSIIIIVWPGVHIFSGIILFKIFSFVFPMKMGGA